MRICCSGAQLSCFVLELTGKGNVDCCNYCTNCFLAQFAGVREAVWELLMGLPLASPSGDALCRDAFFRSFVLWQLGGKCHTSKPGALILRSPMGLKVVAASGLQVVGIKGPEQWLKGQLATTELAPGSASQPGRLLSPH